MVRAEVGDRSTRPRASVRSVSVAFAGRATVVVLGAVVSVVGRTLRRVVHRHGEFRRRVTALVGSAPLVQRHHVRLNDLNAHITPEFERLHTPKDLHYTREGSEFLAKQVAAEIEKMLRTLTPKP